MIYVNGLHGKDRTRVNMKTGSVYTPKPTKDFQSLVKRAYITQGGQNFLDQPVELILIAYYRIPESYRRRVKEAMASGRIPPMKKPDIDNVVKIVMDALNGVAYNDDKQVMNVSATKMYHANDPAIAFEIRRWREYEI